MITTRIVRIGLVLENVTTIPVTCTKTAGKAVTSAEILTLCELLQ